MWEHGLELASCKCSMGRSAAKMHGIVGAFYISWRVVSLTVSQWLCDCVCVCLCVSLCVSTPCSKNIQLQTTSPESKFPIEYIGVIFIQIDQHLKKLFKKYKGFPIFWNTVYMYCSQCKVDSNEVVLAGERVPVCLSLGPSVCLYLSVGVSVGIVLSAR